MSFNHRRSVGFSCASTAKVDVFTSNEKTGAVTRKVKDAHLELPSPDTYDVDKMIKAGLDLRKVNTSVLPGRVDASAAAESAQPEQKIEEKKENE